MPLQNWFCFIVHEDGFQLLLVDCSENKKDKIIMQSEGMLYVVLIGPSDHFHNLNVALLRQCSENDFDQSENQVYQSPPEKFLRGFEGPPY